MRFLGKMALVVGLPAAAMFATASGASATTADGPGALFDDVVGAEVNVIKLGGGSGSSASALDLGQVTGVLGSLLGG
ncbi:hypothetical protein [Actinosynnema sp. NPDC020468]|uniref:hypothetical protein n=1 Tax=Actinosynnema sp. NPDC020468 TaxID=3154488 RepID=UPI0033CFB187